MLSRIKSEWRKKTHREDSTTTSTANANEGAANGAGAVVGAGGASAAAAIAAVAASSASSSAPRASVSAGINRYREILNEYMLLMEYKKVLHHAPSGLYVMPSLDSLRCWHGVVFVRSGPYSGGIFKFIINIPQAYPDQAPRVVFTTELFHPHVHPSTGELDISVYFPTWLAHQHYLFILLCYIKQVFYRTSWWREPASLTSGSANDGGGGGSSQQQSQQSQQQSQQHRADRSVVFNPHALALWLAPNNTEFLERAHRCSVQSFERCYNDSSPSSSVSASSSSSDGAMNGGSGGGSGGVNGVNGAGTTNNAGASLFASLSHGRRRSTESVHAIRFERYMPVHDEIWNRIVQQHQADEADAANEHAGGGGGGDDEMDAAHEQQQQPSPSPSPSSSAPPKSYLQWFLPGVHRVDDTLARRVSTASSSSAYTSLGEFKRVTVSQREVKTWQDEDAQLQHEQVQQELQQHSSQQQQSLVSSLVGEES